MVNKKNQSDSKTSNSKTSKNKFLTILSSFFWWKVIQLLRRPKVSLTADKVENQMNSHGSLTIFYFSRIEFYCIEYFFFATQVTKILIVKLSSLSSKEVHKENMYLKGLTSSAPSCLYHSWFLQIEFATVFHSFTTFQQLATLIFFLRDLAPQYTTLAWGSNVLRVFPISVEHILDWQKAL